MMEDASVQSYNINNEFQDLTYHTTQISEIEQQGDGAMFLATATQLSMSQSACPQSMTTKNLFVEQTYTQV